MEKKPRDDKAFPPAPCKLFRSRKLFIPLWIAVGVVALLTLLQSCKKREPPQAIELVSKPAWGTPVAGLQAGLSFDGAKKERYKIGESIAFALHIKNASNNPISLEYVEPALKSWIPRLRDDANSNVPVLPLISLGGGIVRSPTLAPGQEIIIGSNSLELRPMDWMGKVGQAAAFGAGGRNHVSLAFTFGPHHYRPSGVYPWAGTLTTGELEIEATAKKQEIKEGMREALMLLSDFQRDGLRAMHMDASSDDWMKKRQAWEARCASLSPETLKYLGQIARRSDDPGYRAIATNALGNAKKQAGAEEDLLAGLNDAAPEVRREAVKALGAPYQESHVVPVSTLLLREPDAGIRLNAAYALGMIGSGKATASLLEALKVEKDKEARGAILGALGMIADPAALPALKEALANSDEMTRSQLQRAIRAIEDPDFIMCGMKRGVSEKDMVDALLGTLNLTSMPFQTDMNKMMDLFREKASASGSRMQEGVESAFQAKEGNVYYIKSKQVFYIWIFVPAPRNQSPITSYSNAVAARALPPPPQDRFYGPFPGNPFEIARQALANPMLRK